MLQYVVSTGARALACNSGKDAGGDHAGPLGRGAALTEVGRKDLCSKPAAGGGWAATGRA